MHSRLRQTASCDLNEAEAISSSSTMVIAGSVPPAERQDHPLEVFLKYAEPFLCGGAGGVMATTLIQPIDTVKVDPRNAAAAFPQARSHSDLPTGSNSSLRRRQD